MGDGRNIGLRHSVRSRGKVLRNVNWALIELLENVKQTSNNRGFALRANVGQEGQTWYLNAFHSQWIILECFQTAIKLRANGESSRWACGPLVARQSDLFCFAITGSVLKVTGCLDLDFRGSFNLSAPSLSASEPIQCLPRIHFMPLNDDVFNFFGSLVM